MIAQDYYERKEELMEKVRQDYAQKYNVDNTFATPDQAINSIMDKAAKKREKIILAGVGAAIVISSFKSLVFNMTSSENIAVSALIGLGLGVGASTIGDIGKDKYKNALVNETYKRIFDDISTDPNYKAFADIINDVTFEKELKNDYLNVKVNEDFIKEIQKDMPEVKTRFNLVKNNVLGKIKSLTTTDEVDSSVKPKA